MSENDLKKIIQFSDELKEIERAKEAEKLKIQSQFHNKMEPLFLQRHEALKGVPGFWSGVLSSPETPLAEKMNGTFDSKIAKAVTDFQILTRIENGKQISKVVLSFKPNVMLEAGTVHREVEIAEGNKISTLSIEPIKWKKGTENLRTNSLFSFFDEKANLGDEELMSTLFALDIIFQDPFIATIPDE